MQPPRRNDRTMTDAEKTNAKLVEKYRLDNNLDETFFKDSKRMPLKDVVYPLRIDNRQYCSPTDYQGSKPSCCGYTAA